MYIYFFTILLLQYFVAYVVFRGRDLSNNLDMWRAIDTFNFYIAHVWNGHFVIVCSMTLKRAALYLQSRFALMLEIRERLDIYGMFSPKEVNVFTIYN